MTVSPTARLRVGSCCKTLRVGRTGAERWLVWARGGRAEQWQKELRAHCSMPSMKTIAERTCSTPRRDCDSRRQDMYVILLTPPPTAARGRCNKMKSPKAIDTAAHQR